MKILDRYIARQLLGVTALGVMALSALLLLGNLFKELRPLLVENKAPISIVLEFIFQVIPFSLMFSIPWGFLTAVLLVYGRLASDNELTSMRMSGMSLWRLSAPAIAIGIALSGLCYWINIDIAPRAKQSISELLIKAASINPKGLLNEGQAITKFDNLEIYIDKRVDDVIHGMHIYQKADDKSPSVAMHSERVTMDFSPEKKILTLHLINPLITTQEEGSISQSVTMDEMPLSINLDKSRSRRIKANRFTNREIREALDTPGYLDKKADHGIRHGTAQASLLLPGLYRLCPHRRATGHQHPQKRHLHRICPGHPDRLTLLSGPDLCRLVPEKRHDAPLYSAVASQHHHGCRGVAPSQTGQAQGISPRRKPFPLAWN